MALLIQRGANVNAVNFEGYTPLVNAVKYGNVNNSTSSLSERIVKSIILFRL